MRRLLTWVVLSSLLGLGLACASGEQQREQSQAAPPEPETPQTPGAVETRAPEAEPVVYEDYPTYDGVGVVKLVTPGVERIIVDHEEIPGFMRAMTMPFLVEDLSLLEGIEPGDSVSFHLERKGQYYKITRMQKTGTQDE